MEIKFPISNLRLSVMAGALRHTLMSGNGKVQQGTKILIIGGGAIAEQAHIPAAVELLGQENVYLAEPDPRRCDDLVSTFGLRYTSPSYSDFLEATDLAIVATPPHLHASIAADCLRSGLAVLCEKPLANTSAECRSILTAARESGRVLGVCHNYRYFPNRVLVRRKLKTGDLGQKVSIDIIEGGPANWPTQSGYTFRKDLVPGGVLLNNGVHSIDFLLWCLGQPVTVEYRDDSLGGLESNAEIKLGFENGCYGRLWISRTCHMSNEIVVKGESQTIKMPVFHMNRMTVLGRSEEFVDSSNGRVFKDKGRVPVLQLADFLQAVTGDRPSPCTGEEGTTVIDLIKRCYALKRTRPLPQKAPVPCLMW